MSLLTGPVTFGAVVRIRDDKLHYLVVDWNDRDKQHAVLARPDGCEAVYHVHWLSVVKHPQRWVSRAKR